ncbi:hypothetical protein H6G76_00130 [Nostoc sp. FACHB-152]|uniref:hypothetical protein n=1 Tax=unclassified Nostoc TaxID=2593658 RepID=UPI001686DCE9|nr:MULTISPECIES: hypothetical protein [unclassified Nostoc]MBD2445579.1 hypothetical protein [Nostoc sp. FACHB-152]MBD2466691.1 hypothetical protein [Nostoc sp. FACHB-145]
MKVGVHGRWALLCGDRYRYRDAIVFFWMPICSVQGINKTVIVNCQPKRSEKR